MLLSVRQNRLMLLGAAIGAAAVVVVVLIVVGSKDDAGSTATDATATTVAGGGATAPTATAALAGVPQHGDTLGKPSAAVTLTIFEDPQCPFCRQWNVDTLPTVVTRYVKTGRIKLVYRGIEIIGPNSEPGLRAIYAAATENKLWTLVEELYLRQGDENSGWITDAVIRSAARAAGANPSKIVAGMSSQAVVAGLKQAEDDAAAVNVRGTPTFVVERPPAVPQPLSVPGLDPASFIPALDAALQ
jgi:protein-disulfide isomerase